MTSTSSGFRTRILALLSIASVMPTLFVGAAGTAVAARIRCDDTRSNKKPFYNGKSASRTYDKRFKSSHRIPGLASYIPQGTATWSNWEGQDDLILITSYDKPGRKSIISGVDAKTGEHVGYAQIAYSHVGGIAVFEKQGWAYVSGAKDGTIRKYSLPKLKEAIKTFGTLSQDGKQQIVYASSFLTSHGPSDTLWAGSFEHSKRGNMHSYTVRNDGDLGYRPGTWQVPTKTQGLVVTKDVFIYSTSLGRNNRSNIYVVRRGKGSSSLNTARMYCFRAPSMSEGLTVYGKGVYVAYESGARYYSGAKDKPINIIEDLHKAPLSSLKKLARRTVR